ncbi:FAD-dependent oxidoreductase [Marinicella sp. S1101]|uniref:NAD(P)/FAD-dependent oxidoreductase n=1 Tax=Marinicella marina TaxID=2996016 RepID=UPI002260BBC3|nr:FAD-dependent oxidoreductase [Marinicella marina]MCX7553924.1 FAD-dependent oxidoreductase [Marinicella marina]MDJ1140416.1 FAD-dependent oxidoreductase [Marinicella marina]
MKVAIIGGGVSGLMAADGLNGHCDYTLFEAADYLGGHANTQTVSVDGQTIKVDTGFIVFNQDVYTNFCRVIDKYGVESIKSDMSFAVANRESGLEYNATSLRTLFCQKRNLFNPKFYRMIWDIKRFYTAAEGLLNTSSDVSVYEYLVENNYSDYFINEHIIPMVSALWSGDFNSVKDYPLVYMLQFMKNHQMLQINQRPEWRTIKGGSEQYVKAIAENMQGQHVTGVAVDKVSRKANQVTVHAAGTEQIFDAVVFATHTDTVLKILEGPTEQERQSMAAIEYVENQMDLHTDASLLPTNKHAWASWSVNKHREPKAACTVNYYMNLLQSLPCKTPVIVSLNQSEYIKSEKKLLNKTYHHPVYNRKTLTAQQSISQIQGNNNSYYCGAYLGWGFHEDGARSGVEVADLIKQL